MSGLEGDKEASFFQPEEVNGINSGLVKYLRKILKEYPFIKELTKEGRIDFLDPTRRLDALNWE